MDPLRDVWQRFEEDLQTLVAAHEAERQQPVGRRVEAEPAPGVGAAFLRGAAVGECRQGSEADRRGREHPPGHPQLLLVHHQQAVAVAQCPTAHEPLAKRAVGLDHLMGDGQHRHAGTARSAADHHEQWQPVRCPPLHHEKIWLQPEDLVGGAPPGDRVEAVESGGGAHLEPFAARVRGGVTGEEPLWVLTAEGEQLHRVPLTQGRHQLAGVQGDAAAVWPRRADRCDAEAAMQWLPQAKEQSTGRASVPAPEVVLSEVMIALAAAVVTVLVALGVGSFVLTPACACWSRTSRWLLRLVLGVGLVPLQLLVVHEVTGVPVGAPLALVLAVAGLGLAVWQERRWRSEPDDSVDTMILLLLAIGLLFTALAGLDGQPGFDGLDPWQHAFSAAYVADTGVLRQPDPSFPLLHYVDAYPPLFDLLLAVPIALLGSVLCGVQGRCRPAGGGGPAGAVAAGAQPVARRSRTGGGGGCRLRADAERRDPPPVGPLVGDRAGAGRPRRCRRAATQPVVGRTAGRGVRRGHSGRSHPRVEGWRPAGGDAGRGHRGSIVAGRWHCWWGALRRWRWRRSGSDRLRPALTGSSSPCARQCNRPS